MFAVHFNKRVKSLLNAGGGIAQSHFVLIGVND